MKVVPKVVEKLFYFFPLLHLGLVLYAISLVFQILSFKTVFIFFVVTYLLPPLLWLMIKLIWGSIPTVSYVGKNVKSGNLWFISYRLQYLFNSFPFVENILKFIPGAYSFWLRLWGSKVGKKINWAPETYLVDRTNLILGDRILIGNKTYITSHVLKKKDNRYLLFFKPVEIGDDALISFSCTLGPGLVLPHKSFLRAFAVEYQSAYKDKVDLRGDTLSE